MTKGRFLILLLLAFGPVPGIAAQPGSLDTNFNAGAGPNGPVAALAVRGDGPVLVGGAFTEFSGLPRSGVAQLQADGSLDAGFAVSPDVVTAVSSIAIQPDSRVLLASTVPGPGGAYAVRVNEDGSVDDSFAVTVNGPVHAAAVGLDGAIWLGGEFTMVNGLSRIRVVRLTASGAVDESFDPGAGPNDTVLALLPTADGDVLLGGKFYNVAGTNLGSMVRLKADGLVDLGFRPRIGIDYSDRPLTGQAVRTIASQPDGKLVVGGDFFTQDPFNSTRTYHGLRRLLSNGQADIFFNAGGTAGQGAVHSVLLEANGRIVVGGAFISFNWANRPYLARLDADGNLDDCLIASSNASPNGVVYALARQGNDRILAAGGFTAIGSVSRSSLAGFRGGEPPLTPPTVELVPVWGWPRPVFPSSTRFDAVATSCHGQLGYQWFQNGILLTGQRSASLIVSSGQDASGAGYYSVVVSNSAGMATSSVVRLDVGMQNFEFNTTNGPFRWTGAPVLSAVWSVLPLRNGQVLVGGPFEQVEGLEWAHLARLNPDGSLDRTFTARPNHPVRAMIEQPDGRILIAGEFNAVNNEFRDRVARLEPDGSLDPNFPVRLGLNGIMQALALQPDGKVILGGAFHVPRNDAPWIHNIIRLETNGLVDFTFDPGTNLFAVNIASNFVRTVAVLPDGRIMAGGSFSRAAQSSRNYLARLLPDGSVDTTFGVEEMLGPGGAVYAMAVQADGLLVIGGSFTNVHGVARTNLARLLPDGSLDESFRPQAIPGGWLINALAVDPGGRVLTVHSSPEFNGNFSNSRVFRFDASGRIESNQMSGFVFRGGNYAGISTLAPKEDGGTFIGGTFDIIDGVTRRRVALLLGDPPGPPAFSVGPTSQVIEATQDLLLSASVSVSSATFFQWFQNGEALPAGTNVFLVRSAVATSASGDYWLVASNRFGVSTSSVATVTVLESGRPGSVVLSFTAWPGAGSNVVVLAETGDGRLYVGGGFNRFHGSNVSQLVRLENSGIVDPRFTQPALINGGAAVSALLPRTDGSVIVAYRSQIYQPTIRSYLSNGSSDPAWKFQAMLFPTYYSSPSFPSQFPVVANLIEDEQGRIIAAGSFIRLYVGNSWVNQGIRYGLRLFSDGTLDTGFVVRLGSQGGNELDDVYAMSMDPEGNTVLGGYPNSQVGASLRLAVFRLNHRGQDDGSIRNTTLDGPRDVHSLVMQPDGRMLVTGHFSTVQGSSRPGLARLFPDGRLDDSFVPWAGAGAYDLALALQPGGKILVTAGNTNLNGPSRNTLLRLNSDGSLDAAFDVGKGADGYVGSALVRQDGKILVGGRFRHFSGFRCGNIALLHGGPAEAPVVTGEPQSPVLIAGDSLTLSPLVTGYPPPSLQWLKNGELIPGATKSKFRLPGVRLHDAGEYLLVASNASGVSTTLVAAVSIQPPPLRAGIVDPAFSADAITDGEVNVIVLQNDGRVLVGGNFTRIAGVPRAGIARLLADGAVDRSFNPGTALSEMPSNNIYVSRIVLQPDGKLVAGGSFNRFNGVARRGVVRLDPDGAVDESLPDVGGWPLLAQPDGKLLMGEHGIYLRRLHPDGTEDASFTVSSNVYSRVYAASMLADGRILVAGDISGNVARLMADGSPDVSFENGDLSFQFGPINDICFPIPQGASPQPLVHTLCVQTDGGILLGGVFRNYASPEQWNLVRLLPSGRWDTNFNQRGGPNFAVRTIAVQPDGKILIGGCFTNLGYFPVLAGRQHLARLNPDGSVDPSFNPGAGFRGTSDGYVRAIAMQPDGRILIGGQFDTVDGVRRNNLARLSGEVILFETITDGPEFSTRVATTEGRTYWLETRESADGGDWAIVNTIAGDGTDQVLTDFFSNGGKRFYRVRVE